MLNFLKYLRQKINNLISRYDIDENETSRQLDAYLKQISDDHNDIDDDDDDDESEELELDDVLGLFEDYIGLVIVKFEAYQIGIPDLSQLIVGKIITKVFELDKKIVIELNNIANDRSNQLILSLGESGFFAEMEKTDPLHKNAKYRIIFVGGSIIEYIDTQIGIEINYK